MTLSGRNEASTRTDLIDTQLARAGWSRSRRTLIEEFLLKATEPDSTYGNEQFAGYVLLGSDSKPIAVVEASFADWFHPYLRPANGAVTLGYVLPDLTVTCTSTLPEDQPKVVNLNRLLNLANRWTREFKAEYANQQDVLRRRERHRVQQTQARHTLAEVLAYVQQWQGDLPPREPHHEVYQALCAAMLEPARLAAWHSELGLMS